ncbi:MAG: heparinase II/III family protein, partial [Methanomicrobiales archaeon]|nr:heparinase II/III family protein [Methanomicrobiales archaeon]
MTKRFPTVAVLLVLLLFPLLLWAGGAADPGGVGAGSGPGHPQLYFTAEEATLLRTKVAAEPYQSWFRDVRSLAKGIPFPKGPSLTPQDLENAARALRTNAFVYAVSGDEEYGLRAKGYLLQACALPHWQSADRLASGQLLSYGSGAMHGAIGETYDWIYPLLTAEERTTVQQAMVAKSLEPLLQYHGTDIEARDFNTNRIALAYGGVGGIALALRGDLPDDPVVSSAAGIVHDTLIQEYFDRFDRDGAWTEGIGYVSFGLSEDAGGSGGLYYAEALRRATGEDLFRHQKFKHLPEFLIYFLPPDRKGESDAFGDEDFSGRFHSAPAAALASRTGNPYGQWYYRNAPLENPDPIGLILFADESLPAASPDSLPLARWFRDAGWVAMRTGWGTGDTLVGFKSGPFNPGNDRPEQNSFFLDALGERLVILPGLSTKGYDSNYLTWYDATLSQNTILLDKDSQSQVIHPPEGASVITRFLSTQFSDQVQGSAGDVYKGKLSKFTRDLVFVKHDAPGYLVVYDDLAATRPVEFDFLLHGLGATSIRSGTFGTDTISITRPTARLYVKMMSPDALRYTVLQGKPTSLDNVDQATSYARVATTTKQRDTRFLAVLYPLGSRETAPQVTEIGATSLMGVTVEKDGWEDTLIFSTTGGGIRYRDIIAEGRMVLVSKQGGQVQRVTLQDGTSLTAAGQRQITSKNPVSAALQFSSDGIEGTIQAMSPTSVSIPSEEPQEVRVNGSPAPGTAFAWNSSSRTLTLTVPSGDTEIQVSYSTPAPPPPPPPDPTPTPPPEPTPTP